MFQETLGIVVKNRWDGFCHKPFVSIVWTEMKEWSVPKGICAAVKISWEPKYEVVIVPQRRTRDMVRKFGKPPFKFRSVLSLF